MKFAPQCERDSHYHTVRLKNGHGDNFYASMSYYSDKPAEAPRTMVLSGSPRASSEGSAPYLCTCGWHTRRMGGHTPPACQVPTATAATQGRHDEAPLQMSCDSPSPKGQSLGVSACPPLPRHTEPSFSPALAPSWGSQLPAQGLGSSHACTPSLQSGIYAGKEQENGASEAQGSPVSYL